MNLLLKFENEEKLTAWGSSDLHDVEVGKLNPYRTKPYDATRINFINYISKEGSYEYGGNLESSQMIHT